MGEDRRPRAAERAARAMGTAIGLALALALCAMAAGLLLMAVSFLASAAVSL